MIEFSSEKYSGSTGHKNSLYQWRNLQWGWRRWDFDWQPEDYKPSALAIEIYTAHKLLMGISWVYPVGVLHHYIFIISHLLLTSHPRSTVVVQDRETAGTSIEIYSEDAEGETRTGNEILTVILKVRFWLATRGLQNQCSSDWPIQHKSYYWELVEFIQLVYCIIVYLSFLNCDWLLIREVQLFYWTKKLLEEVEKFIVMVSKVRLEFASPGLKNALL